MLLYQMVFPLRGQLLADLLPVRPSSERPNVPEILFQGGFALLLQLEVLGIALASAGVLPNMFL